MRGHRRHPGAFEVAPDGELEKANRILFEIVSMLKILAKRLERSETRSVLQGKGRGKGTGKGEGEGGR